MEYLPDSLKEAMSKLSDNQREEIDLIESIVNVSKDKEALCEKVINYIKKHSPENCELFILSCLKRIAVIRPKEREDLFFIIDSIFKNCSIDISNVYLFDIIDDMMKQRGLMPIDENDSNYDEHVFDFANKGTIDRAIYDDNLDDLKEILVVIDESQKNELININGYLPFWIDFIKGKVTQLDAAALFGSIKCFKYLMMNQDNITDDTCVFAVAGGNSEIIHICEQKGLKFEKCLRCASTYHRFEIYDWLNQHFEHEKVPLTSFNWSYCEPLFYYNVLNGEDIF